MEKKPKVLFFSTGNSTRSQIAEGFLRTMAGDRFDAASTAVESVDRHPLSAEVMKEVQIDISAQHPKGLPQALREHFSYVITFYDSSREKSPTFPFTVNLLRWNLADPTAADGSAEEKKATFRRVRDQIRDCIRDFLSESSRKEQERAQLATSLR